jgi:imidazole glycerol-phosphate synthase subunit HisH
MLVIVDYGVGNLGSLLNMCKYLGIEAMVSSNESEISEASHIILPGVGAFDHGMKCLKNSGLLDILNRCVLENRTSVLGICLGMQLMSLGSDEGEEEGLGWINASVSRIPNTGILKVPHMGWSRPKVIRESILFSNNEKYSRYYFVHSYCVSCNEADAVATVEYGVKFDVAFEKNNIFGVQFHPEKSHQFGMRIISNFVKYKNK